MNVEAIKKLLMESTLTNNQLKEIIKLYFQENINMFSALEGLEFPFLIKMKRIKETIINMELSGKIVYISNGKKTVSLHSGTAYDKVGIDERNQLISYITDNHGIYEHRCTNIRDCDNNIKLAILNDLKIFCDSIINYFFEHVIVSFNRIEERHKTAQQEARIFLNGIAGRESPESSGVPVEVENPKYKTYLGSLEDKVINPLKGLDISEDMISVLLEKTVMKPSIVTLSQTFRPMVYDDDDDDDDDDGDVYKSWDEFMDKWDSEFKFLITKLNEFKPLINNILAAEICRLSENPEREKDTIERLSNGGNPLDILREYLNMPPILRRPDGW